MVIGLDGYKAFNASETNTFIDVNLTGKEKLLPRTSIKETISKYEVYTSEREACTKYRFIFAVSPICTNVLFNKKTEVVEMDGTDSCKAIYDNDSKKDIPENAINKSNINLLQCIRDTEYSHPLIANYTYHCGGDIFNNHLLRNKGFIFVNKTKEKTEEYNTLSDYVRLETGDVYEEDLSLDPSKLNKMKRHIYDTDSLYNFNETLDNRLIEKYGWFGFTNTSTLDVPNGEITTITENLKINKIINNLNPCDFVELYPTRDLFSFNPKYNKSRKRLEKNWDYVITYPYENDYEMFNTVCENDKGALKIISYEVTHTGTGAEVIRFKTMFKHNLSIGKYVSLYFQKGKVGDYGKIIYEDIEQILSRFQVVAVGDSEGEDKTRYFSLRVSDLNDIFCVEDKTVKNNEVDEVTVGQTLVINGDSKYNSFKFYYKNNINNIDCDYYFRKFKVYRDITASGECPSSNINKLAFADTIYGDGVSQIVYTDDVDINGLLDNLGRPVNELFLTVIKTNRGYQEWYESGDTSSEKVEYSHAFGKVTSGLDLPSECFDYNIHKLHNIDLNQYEKLKVEIDGVTYDYSPTLNAFGESFVDEDGNVLDKPKYIEDIDDAIRENYYDEFYGDVVEFNTSNYTETILEKVYHRVNTAQRETTNEKYKDLFYDEIKYDDFDVSIDSKKEKVFEVNTSRLNSLKFIKGDTASSGDTTIKCTAGNLAPEGYFYSPHNRIKVREEVDTLYETDAELINISSADTSFVSGLCDTYIDVYGNEVPVVDEYGNAYYYDEAKFVSPTNFGFTIGDMIAFYNAEKNETIWGYLYNIKDKTELTVRFDTGKIDGDLFLDLGYRIMYVSDNSCPTYSKYVPIYSKYVWKNVIPISKVDSESELYETPFANGRHYVEKNINVFLRRQDPVGEYYMMNYDEEEGVKAVSESRRIRKRGMPKYDFSGLFDGVDNNINIC